MDKDANQIKRVVLSPRMGVEGFKIESDCWVQNMTPTPLDRATVVVDPH